MFGKNARRRVRGGGGVEKVCISSVWLRVQSARDGGRTPWSEVYPDHDHGSILI